jgi:hypothetical protein
MVDHLERLETQTRQRQHCAATTAEGEMCRGTPVTNSLFCWAHAPELEAKRTEAYRHGGRTRKIDWAARMDVPIGSLDDVLAYLNTIKANLDAQDNTASVASAMTRLAQAFVDVLEQRDMGARLDEIEEQLRAAS